MASSSNKSIYEISIGSLPESILDISSTATPCRIRLVDCVQYFQHNILRIIEFSDFPDVAFSTISYVWRGNPTDPSKNTFSVRGAEDGDPINIDVLLHACAASLQKKINYLWVDRLSIMQTNRDDKIWQIGQMFKIYQSCKRCIVLPGGLQRLVPLDEETSWIHRGWTLQEVLAPKEVMILFAWKLGAGTCNCGDAYGTVNEVIVTKSAIAPLETVVNACVMGCMEFTGAEHSFIVQARIFGAATPNLESLAVATSRELSAIPDIKNHAIWQSTWMRTSSRPVDMVFSIMGLFGVILDVQKFHKDDRLGATKALVREILKSGQRASWLGISFSLYPCNEFSIFPAFPQTSVAGKALLRTKTGDREVAEIMECTYPNDLGLGIPMPQGSLDDEGYFTFTRIALPVVPAENHRGAQQHTPIVIKTLDGGLWVAREDDSKPTDSVSQPMVLVVPLGWFHKYYPGASPARSHKMMAMLIQEHAAGKFSITAFCCLELEQKKWIQSWKEYTLAIGGVNNLNSLVGEGVDELPDYSNHKALWSSGSGIANAGLRWAQPQSVLEAEFTKSHGYVNVLERDPVLRVNQALEKALAVLKEFEDNKISPNYYDFSSSFALLGRIEYEIKNPVV